MGRVVLDTSVVIALLDPQDAHHAAATTAYRDRRETGSAFVLSAVVLSECLVAVSRHSPDEQELRHQSLVAVFGPVRPVDDEVAVTAAQLRARHPALRAPDALILATAVAENATEILTCDRRWAAVDPRVIVVE